MSDRLNISFDITEIATTHPISTMRTVLWCVVIFCFIKRWMPLIKKRKIDNEINKNLKSIKWDTVKILSLLEWDDKEDEE